MNFRVFLFYIIVSGFIINYGTNLNAKNNGRIRITLNPTETQSGIKKIAVFTFNTRAAVNHETQGPLFADQYSKDFQEIGYNCIDREIISKTMKQESLNPSVPVNLDTAIRIGKLLNADGVVLGEVIRTPGKIFDNWRYMIKLVNVETGKVVWKVDAADVYRGEIANRLKQELNKNN